MTLHISKIQQWIFLALIFLAPAYRIRFHVGTVPTNALEIGVAVLCALWAASFITRRSLPSLPAWWKPAAAIACGGVISSFAAPQELWPASFGALKGFLLEPMLVGWIASDIFRNYQLPTTHYQLPRAAQNIVVIVLSAAAVSVLSLAAYLGMAREVFLTWDGRLRGMFLSPNHLAMMLAPAAVLAAGLALFLRDKKTRLLAAASLIPIIPALLLTQSLGGILSVVVAVVFAGFLLYSQLPTTNPDAKSEPRPKRRGYHLRRRILLTTLIVITVVAVLAIKNIAKDLADPRSSWASRVTVWRASVEILKDHWLFGIGPGNFQHFYLSQQEKFPPYLEWAVPQPHNLFLAFWLQTGLLGLVGFFWLLFSVFRRTLHPTSYILYPALFALAAIVLHGLVDTSYWKNDLAVVFWVLLGIVLVR